MFLRHQARGAAAEFPAFPGEPRPSQELVHRLRGQVERERRDYGGAMSALRNEEAERSILGAILLDDAAYTEASQLGLKAIDFSLDSHRRIFMRIAGLIEYGRPMDIITLCNELEAHQDLERVGSVAYVSSLLAGVPDRPSIASYVPDRARSRCAENCSEANRGRW